jgi:hypothetical protein
MSGFLLAKYCPPQGARQSWIMWLIIGLTTLVGPILIVDPRKTIEGSREKTPEAIEVVAAAGE